VRAVTLRRLCAPNRRDRGTPSGWISVPGALRLAGARPLAEANGIDARDARPMRAPEAWVVFPLLAAWAVIVDIPFFTLDGSDDGF
jgi:hypothetical protein